MLTLSARCENRTTTTSSADLAWRAVALHLFWALPSLSMNPPVGRDSVEPHRRVHGPDTHPVLEVETFPEPERGPPAAAASKGASVLENSSVWSGSRLLRAGCPRSDSGERAGESRSLELPNSGNPLANQEACRRAVEVSFLNRADIFRADHNVVEPNAVDRVWCGHVVLPRRIFCHVV
jgi:hypothetical protein